MRVQKQSFAPSLSWKLCEKNTFVEELPLISFLALSAQNSIVLLTSNNNIRLCVEESLLRKSDPQDVHYIAGNNHCKLMDVENFCEINGVVEVDLFCLVASKISVWEERDWNALRRHLTPDGIVLVLNDRKDVSFDLIPTIFPNGDVVTGLAIGVGLKLIVQEGAEPWFLRGDQLDAFERIFASYGKMAKELLALRLVSGECLEFRYSCGITHSALDSASQLLWQGDHHLSIPLSPTDGEISLTIWPGEAPLHLIFRNCAFIARDGKRTPAEVVGTSVDRREGWNFYFFTKLPEITFTPQRDGDYVSLELHVQTMEAGAVAGRHMTRILSAELMAAHHMINAKAHDAANYRAQFEAIQSSLTWRSARLFLNIFDMLMGRNLMSRVAALLQGKPKPTQMLNGSEKSYSKWVAAYDTLAPQERREMESLSKEMDYRPLFSIILPTYNTPKKWLKRCIESVRKQVYPFWELCIADDASSKPHVRKILNDYKRKDSRINVTFRETNGHISAASNSAIELATGDFLALLDHDDELSAHALYSIAKELNKDPSLDMLYTDEDKIDAKGRRFAPHFKPDWNPDMLLSQNYVCHLTVIRKTLVDNIGGFREGYEGSQDYDLILRASRATTPKRIKHISRVCYHWRAVEGSTALSLDFKDYCTASSRKAVSDHLEALELPAQAVAGVPACIHRVAFCWESYPLISIIIPTKNRVDLLKPLVEDILWSTAYEKIELIIIDHESDEPETCEFLQNMALLPRVKILPYEGEFNYSRMNNLAVHESNGDVLVFLNNDLHVLTDDWLVEMLGHVLRPDIGAVGAKLYFPDDTIQHAGLILGINGGIAESQFQGLPREEIGFAGRTHILQNISAVTAACMMIRRRVFDEVGGFDEENLKVAFNDVDLCLELRKLGYRNLFTPFAQFHHFESASRGSDQTDENRERFAREVDYMLHKWRDVLSKDPYYNPNLSLECAHFNLSFPPNYVK